MKTRIRLLLPLLLCMAGMLLPGPAAADGEPVGFEFYHTYAENLQVIDDAVAAHPEIAQRFSIGKSYEGREIWGIKISDNVGVDENEPEVFIHGLTHARERLSNEMALYIIGMLTDGYASNARIKAIVDSREIWIVPMLNPDGAEFDMSDGHWHRWRKNRQRIPGSTEIGIDLNRNWGYQWGCCGSGSAKPGSDNYRGWAPEVAPEVQAYEKFIDSRVVDGRQQIRASIGWHTAGRMVLWPYAYTKADTPPDMSADDQLAMTALGQQLAALNGYTAGQGSDLYIVDGDQDDWAYHKYRIFAYTFEMAKGAQKRYYPTQSEVDAELANNRQAVLHFFEMADCPYRAAGLDDHCGPLNDDFETGRGWVVNPNGTDTATDGQWQRADPKGTHNAAGAKQLGGTVSGMADLVTGRRGGKVNADDVDGGLTSVESPAAKLGAGTGRRLDFRYSFAHNTRSTAADFLRVSVNGTEVFSQAGFGGNRNAVLDASRRSTLMRGRARPSAS